LCAAIGLGAPVAAEAKGRAPAVAKSKAKGAAARTPASKRPKLVCKGRGKARKCQRVAAKGKVSSRRAKADELRAAPAVRPSGWVRIVVPGLDRAAEVNIYNPDGSFNQESLATLDSLWQCKKTHEVHAVDPRLYEMLSRVNDHYGKPVELLSGFRYQQNEGSRHFHASAMDVRVPGVSYKELFEFAQSLDPGGMGIGEYPGMDFVHIDFRAPGEPSVRWTDTARGVNQSDPGKKPSRAWSGPNS
jgi:hypothetical protein